MVLLHLARRVRGEGVLTRVGCCDEPRIGWFIDAWMPALIAIEGVQGD